MQQTAKGRERIKKIFFILKRMEDAMQPDKATPFNGTELRLLKELMLAKLENERLISTQIAVKLGVTRSSVSQMVNKLEKQGVVYRQADEVDRKIAYIVMTEEAEKLCVKELDDWTDKLQNIIVTFGEEKTDEMIEMVEEFSSTAERIEKD